MWWILSIHSACNGILRVVLRELLVHLRSGIWATRSFPTVGTAVVAAFFVAIVFMIGGVVMLATNLRSGRPIKFLSVRLRTELWELGFGVAVERGSVGLMVLAEVYLQQHCFGLSIYQGLSEEVDLFLYSGVGVVGEVMYHGEDVNSSSEVSIIQYLGNRVPRRKRALLVMAYITQ